jgi:molybdopterin-guanine dinucleotide biosynthesis protein B
MKKTPPIICIVGRSGSGKTHLLTELVKTLKQRGYNIGTVKHHTHGDFDIDKEGKDTWKHAKAGSDTVIISSPTKIAIIKKTEHETPLDEIIQNYLTDKDIILTDGYNLSGKPRIIIQQTPEDLTIFNKGKIIAITSKTPQENTIPPKEVESLADKIEQYLKNQRT